MISRRALVGAVAVLVCSSSWPVSAFSPRPIAILSRQHNSINTHASSDMALNFNVPSFQPKNEDDGTAGDNKDDKKLGLKGLIQLVAAGAGSPFLGDYQGTDPETGKMLFSLEANNLVDEDGNSKQTKMPYFESGWVADEDLEKQRQRKAGQAGGGFKLPWQK